MATVLLQYCTVQLNDVTEEERARVLNINKKITSYIVYV
jgi:hypothetical protein